MIYARGVSKGRFRDEVNLDIYLRRRIEESHLLYIKVFYGRMPVYRPWVEFFSIDSDVKINGEIVDYFGSPFEDELIALFSKYIGPGGRIFIEYCNDRETTIALIHDVPPAVTRLGYILFNLGYTWFKDWYFPEGYSEGGKKLQGEKALDEEARIRHLRDIYYETDYFIKKEVTYSGSELYMLKALSRAKEILNRISQVIPSS